ncbi:hypothetical protein [Methylobacterium durans]|uniref:hypothetical protein n=1 Tax=Methylobacterium durans TaxID=2202825 RepID=UPI0013A563CD|nr:hypothetical protein [Methylobacterium durans]
MSYDELWRNGHPLSWAWFHLGDEELKEQYRDAGQKPAQTEWLTSMMRNDLQYALQRGEFVAIGVRMPFTIDTRPSLLPFTIFDHFEQIDWEASTVRNHGMEFASVRISALLDLQEDAAPPISSPVKSKSGRPSVQPLLREIVRELASDPHFGSLLAKERIAQVGEKARKQAPNQFRSERQPARQTIIEALRAEGFWASKS